MLLPGTEHMLKPQAGSRLTRQTSEAPNDPMRTPIFGGKTLKFEIWHTCSMNLCQAVPECVCFFCFPGKFFVFVFFLGYWVLRLIHMRSDPELQIFIFRYDKINGLLMQSDMLKKIRPDKIWLWESDCPSRQILSQKSDDSAHRIIKSKKASVLNQVKI